MRSIYYNLLFIITIFCICIYFTYSAFLSSECSSFFSNKKIKYGLDINGGSYIVMQIDKAYMINDIMSDINTEISSKLKKNNIDIRNISINHNTIKIQLDNRQDTLSSLALIKHHKNIDIKPDLEKFCLNAVIKKSYITIFETNLIKNIIENVRARVDEIGTKDVLIHTQNTDKIIIQIPSVSDPKQVRDLIGKTAKLSFHFFSDPKIDNPNDIEKLYDQSGNEFYIFKHTELSGDTLKNATVSFNKDGNPVIVFKFNTKGSKILAKITKDNIGKLLAIVFDNQILMAPKIREPIVQGSGEINGNFSLKEAQDTAVLLRSGALPVPLNIIEERFVGATLGSDIINNSKTAIIFSIIFVGIIMIFFYRYFGIIAIIALLLNMLITITCIILLGITLTLPGVAGLILTIGMAVDNNILIYENIKDNLKKRAKNSQSNIMVIIKDSFQESKSTILDANITTLIAGLIMFCVGIGAIRGFAIVLSIGILSSIFTSINVTYTITQIFYLLKYKINNKI